jgi:hypothetical protein
MKNFSEDIEYRWQSNAGSLNNVSNW